MAEGHPGAIVTKRHKMTRFVRFRWSTTQNKGRGKSNKTKKKRLYKRENNHNPNSDNTKLRLSNVLITTLWVKSKQSAKQDEPKETQRLRHKRAETMRHG